MKTSEAVKIAMKDETFKKHHDSFLRGNEQRISGSITFSIGDEAFTHAYDDCDGLKRWFKHTPSRASYLIRSNQTYIIK